MGQENRKFKRIRMNLAVIYRIDRPATARLTIGHKEIHSTMVDLSEGGISFLTDCNIPIGTTLLLKFTLFKLDRDDVSFYGPVEILGEVRYNLPLGANEFRLGILFKHIEDQDKSEIIGFINRTPSE